MASTSWLAHHAALISLLILWRDIVICSGLAVDPPEDVVILDPGHLGRLEITWSPPASLMNVADCLLRYQLEYFNTYWDTWSAIRTSKNSYSAQFDLMKDVRVRVYTLLSGPCTNDTMIRSTRYTEVVQKPSSTGVAVKGLICVFHNMEYMECNWGRNPEMLASSKLNLYFWHMQLEHAEECPKYIISDGVRSGCNFTGKSLPDFTDINFCVNGSSVDGPLKPLFISLQTQNQVKPGTTDKLYLHTNPDMQLEIKWESPVGEVPGDCLEWEVEHSQEGADGRMTLQQTLTKETSLTLASIHENEKNCFRVRSKLHKYCADKSFWSEWTRPLCNPVKEATPEPKWDMVSIYVYIAIGIIIMLMLSLSVWAVLKVSTSRQDKKSDSLLTTLFARSSVLTVAEV